MREADTRKKCSATWLIFLSTACAVFAFAPITPASARARRSAARCSHAGSHTILATGSLRVYRTKLRHTALTNEDNVFACWRPTGRTTLLASEDSNPISVTAVKAAAGAKNIIAFSVLSSVGEHDTDVVTSVNVRSGRRIHDNIADESSIDPRINDFIVTDHGSLAWDGTGRGCRDGGVIAIGTDGREQTLECPTPLPSSVSNPIHGLSFAQGMLSWQDGQTPHSVPFS